MAQTLRPRPPARRRTVYRTPPQLPRRPSAVTVRRVVAAGVLAAGVAAATRPGSPVVEATTAGLQLTSAETRDVGDRDGYVGVGESLSPFSNRSAVERLEPGLRAAVREAATNARAEGLELRVNSGWRSTRYQEILFDRAVHEYGSADAARRFVKPPQESAHVSGRAVDVGPPPAAAWLGAHGSRYGLCQIYANEPWHFERRTAPGGLCPPVQTDAAAG